MTGQSPELPAVLLEVRFDGLEERSQVTLRRALVLYVAWTVGPVVSTGGADPAGGVLLSVP
jgi:hypothetical protein